MRKKHRAVFYITFFTALFLYFYTESLLRITVVSNVNEKDFTINKIIDFFPSSMRDDVQYQIDMFSLRDAVKDAKTDKERLMALNNMAFFIKDPAKKEKIYVDILNTYPNSPDSSDAYKYFLLQKSSAHSVSIKKYQEYAKQCPPLTQLYIWQKGWQKLKANNEKEDVQYDYLKALLDIDPQYREYHDLYKSLYYFSINNKDSEISTKAKNKMNASLNKPTLRSILDKIMMEQESKQQKKK